MPSLEHEAPLAILRENPKLLFTLLLKSKKITSAATHEVKLGSVDLSRAVPVQAHADLVVLDWKDGKPASVIIFEMQLGCDPDKKFTWVSYAAEAHNQHRCPVLLVVYSPDPAVADWAEKPIETFQNGGFAPLVLRTDDIPYINSLEVARLVPELAAFSAVIHGPNFFTGPEVSKAAWQAVASLPPTQKQNFRDLIYLTARRAAQKWMEAMMDPQTEARIIKAAQERIFKEGRDEGKAEGEAKGKTEDIVKALVLRKIKLSDAGKQKITACTDLTQLDQWFERALLVSSEAEFFAGITKKTKRK